MDIQTIYFGVDTEKSVSGRTLDSSFVPDDGDILTDSKGNQYIIEDITCRWDSLHVITLNLNARRIIESR